MSLQPARNICEPAREMRTGARGVVLKLTRSAPHFSTFDNPSGEGSDREKFHRVVAQFAGLKRALDA